MGYISYFLFVQCGLQCDFYCLDSVGYSVIFIVGTVWATLDIGNSDAEKKKHSSHMDW